MAAVFLSDLHLGFHETARHRAFRDYLATLRALEDPPEVYILGDLFSYWTGPYSETIPGHRKVLEDLSRTTQAGVSVTLMQGNRDFLLDGRVGVRCGVTVCPDTLPLTLGGRRVLACHGDLFLINDRSHQRFRWLVRSFWIRFLAHELPRRVVRVVAARIRKKSAQLTRKKAESVFTIPAAAAARLFRGGYDVIICGHVHSASCKKIVVDNRDRRLYSLGAWEEEASVLVFDDGEFRFTSFPIS